MNKSILDPCCGSKMFWFNKNNPDVIYGDIRSESHILCDGRELKIAPDEIMDFTNIPYGDSSFKLIVFDPPHFTSLGKNSWMAKKYGILGLKWEEELKRGFEECMRVLEPNGVLIFKWNEKEVKIKEVLELFHTKPLFGHTTGNKGNTMWMCFMKT